MTKKKKSYEDLITFSETDMFDNQNLRKIR